MLSHAIELVARCGDATLHTMRGPTELVEFRVTGSLFAALRYHRVYHYSLALQLNHLVFLHTYLAGVLLLLAAASQALCGGPLILVLSSATYVAFVGAFLRVPGAAAPYCALLVALAAGAWELHSWLAAASPVAAPWWAEPWAVGAGIVLGSLSCQLVGHALHEEFLAPPAPVHGFFAAPPLEWLSLLCRLGARPALLNGLEAAVDEVRQRAREKQALIEPKRMGR